MRNKFISPLFASLVLCFSACASGDKSSSAVVDAAQGLSGKVFAGYQGWYRTPTDGSGLGWEHYETYDEEFIPGEAGIDFWPDMSEFAETAKYATSFKHKDGSTAYAFTLTEREHGRPSL